MYCQKWGKDSGRTNIYLPPDPADVYRSCKYLPYVGIVEFHTQGQKLRHTRNNINKISREARNKRSDHEHEDDPIIAALCQPRKLNKTIIDVNYISGNCNFDLYIYTYKRGV